MFFAWDKEEGLLHENHVPSCSVAAFKKQNKKPAQRFSIYLWKKNCEGNICTSVVDKASDCLKESPANTTVLEVFPHKDPAL